MPRVASSGWCPARPPGAARGGARRGPVPSGRFAARHVGSPVASRESIGRRLRHRLPWLIIGLAGAAASAVLVRGYEADLSRAAVLAVFLPGIVYMADAVGTQTETLIIRGLSVGVPIREVVRRESATGLMIGPSLGGAGVPVRVVVARGDPDVALAVSLSLLAACGWPAWSPWCCSAILRRGRGRPRFRQRPAGDGDPGPPLDRALPLDRDGDRVRAGTRERRASYPRPMERDLRETPLFKDVESFFRSVLEPGFGTVSPSGDPVPSPDGRWLAFRGSRLDRMEGHPWAGSASWASTAPGSGRSPTDPTTIRSHDGRRTASG